MPYSYRKPSRVLYDTQCHRDITAHSGPLNSLEHCICTAAITKIRPDQDLNPVTLELRTTAGSNGPSLFHTQNKLICVPIDVASNIYKHDSGVRPSLGSCRLGCDTLLAPLCPLVKCEILPWTLGAWMSVLT